MFSGLETGWLPKTYALTATPFKFTTDVNRTQHFSEFFQGQSAKIKSIIKRGTMGKQQ